MRKEVSDFEYEIAKYLTLQFVSSGGDIPKDECIVETRHIIEAVLKVVDDECDKYRCYFIAQKIRRRVQS